MPKLTPKLELNVGGMFAGKSSALIAQGKRHLLAGHKVLYIKPDIDDRYSAKEVSTHDGQKVEAITIQTDGKALPFSKWVRLKRADVILIDEVQFFNEKFMEDIQYFLDKGKVIYCSGLDMDYTGKPFEITAQLMAMADEVYKYHAVCADCGEDAYVTAKTSGTGQRVEVGSADLYKPVCRKCYQNYREGSDE